MGRTSVPHLLIDNDIGTNKVVRDCITQNTLRNLLGMAKLNQPVPLQALVMYKSENMRMVDNILLAKYTAAIAQSALFFWWATRIRSSKGLASWGAGYRNTNSGSERSR